MKLRTLKMLSLYDDELERFWVEEVRPLIKYFQKNPEVELTDSITELLTMMLEDDFDGILFNNNGSYEVFMLDDLNQFTNQYLLPFIKNNDK